MNQDEIRFDFHGLGLAIKQAREERGWTQAYVAELVGKTDRTIMNIENKGQHPSFNLFFKLVTMFDISVDQFFHREEQRDEHSCRKHIDVLLNSMNEKRACCHGGHSRRAQESQRNGGSGIRASVFLCYFWVSLNGKQCLCGHKWHRGGLLGLAPNPNLGPTWPEAVASLCSLFSYSYRSFSCFLPGSL